MGTKVTMSDMGATKIKDIHQFLLDKAAVHAPSLTPHFEKHGPLFIPRRLSESLFLFLARTAAQQDVSVAMTDSVWARLLTMARDKSAKPDDTYDREIADELQNSTLTKEQHQLLNHLRKLFLEGLIDEQRLHQDDYQTVQKILSGLRSYGHWSTDMTAIFYFGMPDIWINNDDYLNGGLRDMLGEKNAGSVEDITTVFSPFRSYLALHVWRYLDPYPELALKDTLA